MAFAPSSRERLTAYDLDRFPGETLFARVGRVLCRAGVLPRKELYEAWETARRVRRRFRGGRVLDLGAGHGLLAHLMILLDDSSPQAIALDRQLPASATSVHQAMIEEWPRLSGRIQLVAGDFAHVPAESGDVVVSIHACGLLTDAVIDAAIRGRARLAVLPCCHNLSRSGNGGLTGWMDEPLAVDVMRAVRLAGEGYSVWTQTIPAAITAKNRLLLAAPGPAD